ncbi:MAG TPA: two-component regulator propeller domain-containing protein [Puia sp.]
MAKITCLIFFLFYLCNVQGQNISEAHQLPAPYLADKLFLQEYHEGYRVGNTALENNIRSIAVDLQSNVYVATALGVFKKIDGDTSWNLLPFSHEDIGPAYAVLVDEKNIVWLANWKGVFQYQDNAVQNIKGTEGPISVLCPSKEGIYGLGPKGVWLCAGREFIKKNYPVARSVRSAVSDNNEGLWVASDVGLYHANRERTIHFYKTDILISAGLKGLSLDKHNNLWAAGLGGVTIINENKKLRLITPASGLPTIYVKCVRQSPDGVMWVGTKMGLVRFYPDGKHSLRFSRRWLLDDHVNDICFDPKGNAWIATEQGVSAIKTKQMSLVSKEQYFYNVLMGRHIRAPWIAGQCHLMVPGDTTQWRPEDDDNDGEFTGNYLSMESFRYAASKNEDAREKAKKAFHFLKTLKDITGGDGYFARSIVPVSWTERVHDGNQIYTEKEIAEEMVNEPRFKPVGTRWHTSADGKWLWKGDASSDEWCGHMMGYYFYYKLAADDEEKVIVRQHVASLVDHLIAHNFYMMDYDGKHTRWSVWSPESLNHDPEWEQDKAENSMELLAFLKLAYYMTNDEKYETQYLRMINEQHYLENMSALMDQNPAWFIYYDLTMQVYLFPILIQCEKDPKLKSFYQNYMDKWMSLRIKDQNPLINFLYCYARNKKVEQDASVNFLIDTPLDLVDWSIDHTKREDVKLVHWPMLDDFQVDKLQPPSIRSTVRWDKNPFGAMISGYPDTEREPVFWLYPYWMGRYLKMIQ